MIKIKKGAFTLSEVLITLAVVGVLAALVVPGLIRESANKASITLLQGTVTNLNDAVQKEIVRTRASRIEDTNIWNNPVQFFKDTLEIKQECTGAPPNECYASSDEYKNLDGTTGSLSYSTNAVLLANGVAVDIMKDGKSDYEDKQIPIGIDLNGQQDPNIMGVDRHIVCLAIENDEAKGLHIGDVGGCLKSNLNPNDSKSTLLSACKGGDASACYFALEASGFDYHYLEEDN